MKLEFKSIAKHSIIQMQKLFAIATTLDLTFLLTWDMFEVRASLERRIPEVTNHFKFIPGYKLDFERVLELGNKCNWKPGAIKNEIKG